MSTRCAADTLWGGDASDQAGCSGNVWFSPNLELPDNKLNSAGFRIGLQHWYLSLYLIMVYYYCTLDLLYFSFFKRSIMSDSMFDIMKLILIKQTNVIEACQEENYFINITAMAKSLHLCVSFVL